MNKLDREIIDIMKQIGDELDVLLGIIKAIAEQEKVEFEGVEYNVPEMEEGKILHCVNKKKESFLSCEGWDCVNCICDLLE